MNPETSGAIRHLLTAACATMVGFGWITPEAATALVGNAMAIIIPVAGAAGLAFAFYLSYRAKKPEAAEAKAIAIAVVEKTVSDTKGAPVVAEIEATLPPIK